jgi:hypothetical protein
MPLLITQIYAGNFLNAADLGPLGQRRTAIIHAVAMEEIGEKRQKILILDLVSPSGTAWPKRVTTNKTNATQLGAAYGADAEHWVGKSVEIWAELVMYQGKLVPGVKMLPALARPAAPQPLPTAQPVPQPASAAPAAETDGNAPPAMAAPSGPAWGGPGSDLDDEIPF